MSEQFNLEIVSPEKSFLKKDNTLDESKVLNSIESMIENGADFIDIGAHSTKPGFTKISPQEELDRIGFIFEKLKDYYDTVNKSSKVKPKRESTTPSWVKDAKEAAKSGKKPSYTVKRS